MEILLFKVDDDWCFLNAWIHRNNNIYWLDWEMYEEFNSENINVLCIKNGEYFLYNTKKLIFTDLKDKKLGLCVDNIKSLNELDILNTTYETKNITLNE